MLFNSFHFIKTVNVAAELFSSLCKNCFYICIFKVLSKGFEGIGCSAKPLVAGILYSFTPAKNIEIAQVVALKAFTANPTHTV